MRDSLCKVDKLINRKNRLAKTRIKPLYRCSLRLYFCFSNGRLSLPGEMQVCSETQQLRPDAFQNEDTVSVRSFY